MLNASKKVEENRLCGVRNHLPFSTLNLSTQGTNEWLGKPWDWSSSPTGTGLGGALGLEIAPSSCRCCLKMFLCLSKSSALLFTKDLHTSLWKSLRKNWDQPSYQKYPGMPNLYWIATTTTLSKAANAEPSYEEAAPKTNPPPWIHTKTCKEKNRINPAQVWAPGDRN